MISAVRRPPACFNSAVRCRRMRSTSARSSAWRGCESDQQLVEVRAPAAGPALDQFEVVGREHRDAERAEQVTRTPQRLLVHEGAAAAGGGDLGLDQQATALALALGPHDALTSRRCE